MQLSDTEYRNKFIEGRYFPSHGSALSIGPWRKLKREREGAEAGVIVSSFHDDLAGGADDASNANAQTD